MCVSVFVCFNIHNMSKQILCTHEAEGVQKKKKISKYFILFLYLVEGKRNKEKKND